MKRIIQFLLCFLASILTVQSQETAQVVSKTFHSPDFPFDREIFIYTPPYYNERNQSEYDVVYVFDAQWRAEFALTYGILEVCQNMDVDADIFPFIVVGITSPTTPEYQRSNDFLPVPTNATYQSNLYGNYENFKKFLREDVFTYINSHYRTSGHTLAIGHSLGASFVLNALASEDMFDDYIALSPNFIEDNFKLADNFINYDFNNGKPHFLFLTMSNESEETGWPAEWRQGWDLVKSKMESAHIPESVRIFFKEYPHLTHMTCFVECLMDALPLYSMYRLNTTFNNDKLYPVHITLDAPYAEGDVYITGNQESIINWNPMGLKMNKNEDNTYSIDLNLRLPAEFKFTQGSWESQIIPANACIGNLRIYSPEKTTKHYVAN
ncbi:MAG: hypothetical protein K1W14_14250 [Muribaculaceae bacterium]|uniref:alpha/beta hydrolase-fold protein n=1 Tax=uncultured Bacteroides sp. TaxID=162156 RepID=UPI00321FB789